MEPQNRVGVAQLTSLAFNGVDLHPLRSYLIDKYNEDEDRAGALMDLSVIDQLYGDREQGLAWQRKAFETCTLYRTDRGQPGKKKLLVFALPTDIGGNTPIEFLVPSGEFEIITYYLSPTSTTSARIALPDHDVAFCAAPADSRDAARFSDIVRNLTKGSGTRVLNLYGASAQLDRLSLQHRLPQIAGMMRLPTTVRIERATLEGALTGLAAATLRFPAVIRPVGSHAGHGLARVTGPADLRAYLAGTAEDTFYLSDYIDYASAQDGQFRKYRVVFVDGKAFPCHMAIADQWDVWYLNADMQNSAQKRQEEAAFMDRFDTGFGQRHARSFEAITASVDLDYFGIDCAEDREGNLVVFEADNSLIVHDMDCKTTFPYKGPHMRRIFSAFEAMLRRACQRA